MADSYPVIRPLFRGTSGGSKSDDMVRCEMLELSGKMVATRKNALCPDKKCTTPPSPSHPPSKSFPHYAHHSGKNNPVTIFCQVRKVHAISRWERKQMLSIRKGWEPIWKNAQSNEITKCFFFGGGGQKI